MKAPLALILLATATGTHAAEPATHPPVPIRFHLDEPRTVTLVLEDTEGRRVRNLVGGAGDQQRETAIAIEEAQTMSPPLEPAFFAEAIRRPGKNPEAPAVRRQLTHFAWADANGDYTFSFYTKDAGARLWIDGRLVLDTTQNAKTNKNGRATVTRFQTEPLPMTAGKQVPVKLEYKKTGPGEPHLSWESVSQFIEHVPASALYPGK